MLLDGAQPNASFNIWSAACSAGDEVYTISSILEESNKKKPVRYQVLGTDISNRMIEEAIDGKYTRDRINPLPSHLVKTYFDKISDDKQEWYVANSAVRKHTRFQLFNLIQDMAKQPPNFDIIFCRNVLIYFKEATKLQVVNDLIKKLKPGGYLFLGHCEGMLCRKTDLIQIVPSVFQKPRV
jgi:chemotaxis protein methyltransferase CheR